MSATPSPSVGRGQVTVQPSYFTSSLFVHPLRDDIFNLIQAFTTRYALYPTDEPFTLFKTIWTSQGWPWLHLKNIDARCREIFLNVTCRLFLERTAKAEPAISRAIALFGLYTFYISQPSTSTVSMHCLLHISIPIDLYEALLNLPSALSITPHLLALKPHAIYIISKLVSGSAFHILPHTATHADNPRNLPREISQNELATHKLTAAAGDSISNTDMESLNGTGLKKKTGRPTKRDRLQKTKSSVVALGKWLDKSLYPAPVSPMDPAGAPQSYGTGQREVEKDYSQEATTTHILLSQRPMSSLRNYRTSKSQLLSALEATSDKIRCSSSVDHGFTAAPLVRANAQVLARLQHVDAIAAERGLEVGGEGGERTGLVRVERAVTELINGRGGILGLLEGSGLEDIDGLQAGAINGTEESDPAG